ncbi:hypothetical protein Taro_027429, partial [Colocasia esculenta]|nr:hypothetical protein [Colocasia esculenta]
CEVPGRIAGSSRNKLPPWMSAASSPVDFDGAPNVQNRGASSPASPGRRPADFRMSYGERAVSAAGAAFLSAILVNPLDVAKVNCSFRICDCYSMHILILLALQLQTRLQAQAAGVPYYPNQQRVGMHAVSLGPNTSFSAIRYPPSCDHGGSLRSRAVCPPNCLEYKGTLDVLRKIIRHVGSPFFLISYSYPFEGFARLWRGTNAGIAVAIPTVGIYLPCYDIFRNWIEDFAAQNAPALTPYAPLAAGAVARSLACIACSPIELARTRMQAFKEFGSGAKLPGIWKTLLSVLSPLKNARSANFAAGFASGSLAAAFTCPLDVAKTRRQIEKDLTRALNMTTRETLLEIWRDQGMKGLFTGLGPRVSRAGPSVGLVVSFYEVAKYALHRKISSS